MHKKTRILLVMEGSGVRAEVGGPDLAALASLSFAAF